MAATSAPSPDEVNLRRRTATADLVAGISVALVLIPQSLAYAEIAGVPSYVGLYAAALPPIVAAFVASSPYLQTGPVAMTALLTFGALSNLAPVGSPEYIGLAALLALMVGVVRIGFGAVRAGFVSYLMSQPVLKGFTAAAAILITASQMPRALGVESGGGGILSEAWAAITQPSDWVVAAIVLSAITAIMVARGRKIHPLFPGVLVAVLIGIGYSMVAGYDGPVVGAIPAGFPPISLALPWREVPQLIIPAIVIALVGFAEPAAIARTFATEDRQPWNPDREFISQGLANLASGISGGFPVGGSFSRSSINRLTGGRTRWSGAVTGVMVLVFLLVASVLESLPSAILGAIVIVGVYKLIDLRGLLDVWRFSRLQGVVGIATFVLTLLLAPRIDLAVLIGIGVGVAVHLWRELEFEIEAAVEGEAVCVRPHGVLYFGSAPAMSDRMMTLLAQHPELNRVRFDLASLGRIDYSGAVVLKTTLEDARRAGIVVSLERIPPHARRILTKVWEGTLAQFEVPADR